MSFAIGRRFVIADGVERWKDADAEAVAAAMAGMDGETLTLALFGREEGRYKVPDGLRKAVEAAAGVVAEEGCRQARGTFPAGSRRGPGSSASRSTRAAPRALDRAGRRSPAAAAARAREARARARTGRAIGVAEIEASSASSAERKAWTLADALVAGDEQAAMRALVELRGQGERLPGLLYQIVRRLRDAVAVAEALAAGQPPAQARRSPADAAARRPSASWPTSPSATSRPSATRSR